MIEPHELNQLTNAVEDLLGKIADLKSPDIAALRTRITRTIEDTQAALRNVGEAASDKIRSTASSADGYVRDNPWTAAAVLAAVAAGAAFLAGRATAPKQ